MSRTSYIAFSFVFVLLLAGCAKNADQQQASDSLYWTPPNKEFYIPSWSSEVLVLQLSADPVVYISPSAQEVRLREESFEKLPPQAEMTEEEENDGVIVMPSTLDDILPRIAAFQGEQDAVSKEAVVLISGDDRAPCSSILKAIDCAKRARVKDILFDTFWRDSGKAFEEFSFRGIPFLKYFEFPSGFKPPPELAKNITTVTISKDSVFQWGDTPVTLQDFINRLESLMKNDRDKVLFVVRVDDDTPFPALRYALEQLRRGGFFRVMVAHR